MRVWDQIHVSRLCRQQLLGEHREIHAIWNIITQNKKGYQNHPEVKRWKPYLNTLAIRHTMIEYEMSLRGYKLNSPLIPVPRPPYTEKYPEPWDDQEKALAKKNCKCEKGNF